MIQMTGMKAMTGVGGVVAIDNNITPEPPNPLYFLLELELLLTESHSGSGAG
jgi:hypothetical protein